MKVSVIVPVYNVAQYLAGCLESILTQTCQDFELIVVDDGATDGSGQICDRYQSRYPEKIHLIHQPNQGLSMARNTGLQAARGEYILFVDSDDTIAPAMLEKLLTLAEEKASDLVICAFHSVDEKGNEIKPVREDRLEAGRTYQLENKKALLLCQNAAWNKLYRRGIIQEKGLEFTPGAWYEDVRFVKKYMLHARNITYCDDILYNYLIRQGSIMSGLGDSRNLHILDAMDEVADHYRAQGQYEAYCREIEFLAIEHVFIAALVRTVRSGRKDLREQLRKGFLRRFPDYAANPYIRTLDTNRKLVFTLLKYRLYFVVKLLFAIKK